VTPFFQLTQQQHDQDITLIYLNQTHDTAAYTQDLNQALGDKCIHVLSRTTNKTAANEVVGSRLTADILRQQIGDKLASAQFYLCGGGSVITSTREMLLAL
jgi:ferredoxin-NADP reductase